MGDPSLLIVARTIADIDGSFQMVSLLKLAKVTEEGVRFLSPHDGSPMLLTPEHSMSLQNSIGSDIMMQLDDVIVTTSPDLARMKEAMERSVRWLDRCIKAHKYPERQNLFCIIQGGLDLDHLCSTLSPKIEVQSTLNNTEEVLTLRVFVGFDAAIEPAH